MYAYIHWQQTTHDTHDTQHLAIQFEELLGGLHIAAGLPADCRLHERLQGIHGLVEVGPLVLVGLGEVVLRNGHVGPQINAILLKIEPLRKKGKPENPIR